MNSPLDIKTLWIYIVGFYKNIAEVDLLWQKVSWNRDFQQSCRLTEGMKGQKCFDLARMIIIARVSEVPVPSEGLSVSLMHFPSLFLKHIIIEWPSFEFVQQIMSQKKHVFISRSMNISMKYLRKCAKYLSWNMFEYLKRNYLKLKYILFECVKTNMFWYLEYLVLKIFFLSWV